MPPLKDVTTMITAARSRLIRFTMIVQNFAQLDDVYGKEEAETIRGNCGNIIYLITTELKALEEISKMCGEEKSKKDDKTASTPLVTVSDLQRMKQFEVIILRMRMQPFKTKFTPYFKLNWGRKYPPAKYPTRPKKEVHTFDIKEFVKDQKKKKLLDMMNSADEKDKENMSNGLGNRGPNPMHDALPPELRAIRDKNRELEDNSGPAIPDFLKRERVTSDVPPMSSGRKMVPEVPDYDTFKKQTPDLSSFDPFVDDFTSSRVDDDFTTVASRPKTGFVPRKPVEPSTVAPKELDDDLGFDVDELVKKIDAKIAELEAEEAREKAREEEMLDSRRVEETTPSTAPLQTLATDLPETNPNSINSIYNESGEVRPTTPVVVEAKPQPNITLDDDDDDDFFDDFFDN